MLSAVAMLVAILRDEGYTYEYTYKDPKQKKSGHFLVSRMMQIVINPDTPPPITPQYTLRTIVPAINSFLDALSDVRFSRAAVYDARTSLRACVHVHSHRT